MASLQDEIIDLDLIDDDPTDILPKRVEELAELKKENGNQLYKVKQYKAALNMYTEAIVMCPETASYYGNRSACHIMMQQFREGLEDANYATQLDPSFVKGYLRALKCAIALGDIITAQNAVSRIEQLDPRAQINSEKDSISKLVQMEAEAEKAQLKNDIRKIVYCMDRCLDVAPTCTRYKIRKAETLAALGRLQEAQDIANNILHVDKGNADAIFVRGLCLYYEDNIESAVKHFQQVLRLAPDHTKALGAYKRAKELKLKKDAGNEAYNSNRLLEALKMYSDALAMDPLNRKMNAKLYFNRANVQHKLNKLNEAVSDCSAALNCDESYLKALLRRASCYMDLCEYESAVQDYERACKLNKSPEMKRQLHEAKMQLKKFKRKDYYKILGVNKTATDLDIKKAYRKKALEMHPDRHANATEEVRKQQEIKFKDLGEAYGVLSDPKKKSRYDRGEDLSEMEGHSHHFDPNTVYQTFFSDAANHGCGSGMGGVEFNMGGFPGAFFQFG